MLPAMTDRRALLRKLENVEAFPLIALQALPELRADPDAVAGGPPPRAPGAARPPRALRALRELRAALDAGEAEALLRARELGASLEDIAEALAITRQGV